MNGSKYIYIGQFKAKTKKPQGVGIWVWDTGDIYEGYWKDGFKNGPGRDTRLSLKIIKFVTLKLIRTF